MGRRRPAGLHAAMVDAYREQRWAAELARDSVCIGYRTEEREYAHRMPTFKRWLCSGGWDGFRATAPASRGWEVAA